MLELVHHKLLTIVLSFTPKLHFFLYHAIYQTQEIKGYTTMVKDRIERAHQRRHQIASLGATIWNKMGVMKMQAKYERIKYNESNIDVKNN